MCEKRGEGACRASHAGRLVCAEGLQAQPRNLQLLLHRRQGAAARVVADVLLRLRDARAQRARVRRRAERLRRVRVSSHRQL